MTIKQPLLYENDNDDENLWELKIKTEKLKQSQDCLLLYDDGERLTWNDKRKFLGNYMVIRVQQKGEKTISRPRMKSGDYVWLNQFI